MLAVLTCRTFGCFLLSCRKSQHASTDSQPFFTLSPVEVDAKTGRAGKPVQVPWSQKGWDVNVEFSFVLQLALNWSRGGGS